MAMLAGFSIVSLGSFYVVTLARSYLERPASSDHAPVAPAAEVTRRAFLDVSVDGRPAGRIVLGLYGDVAPRTVENFLGLSRGFVKDAGTWNQERVSFEGTPFHRVIPGFMIQGGDVTQHNGMGGTSIYGSKFRDENFKLKHSGAGVLSMANAGPDTNSSQFFITLGPTGHLDGKHVVFGVVLEGWEVAKMIESRGSRSGSVKGKVLIEKCGILDEVS